MKAMQETIECRYRLKWWDMLESDTSIILVPYFKPREVKHTLSKKVPMHLSMYRDQLLRQKCKLLHEGKRAVWSAKELTYDYK